MKNNKFTQFFLSPVLLLIILCSVELQSNELPGDWMPAPQLGNAYFPDNYQVKAIKCIEGTVDDSVGQSYGDLKYTTQANFEKIASALNGTTSLNLKIPFVKTNASLNYARENAANETRMNWFLEIHATPKSKAFNGSDIRISPAGFNVINSRPGNVSKFCGSEFVYQIDYGAKLIATMSIEFASRNDRRAFEAEASINVNWLLGQTDVSASMATMQQRMGSRTLVKVEAHQTGGRPGELSNILSSQVVECKLNDMQKCLNTFAEIIRYANTNFKEQLNDPNNFSPIRYHTMPYENTAAFDLVPESGFAMLDEMVKRKRQQIQELFEEQSYIYDRASYIRNKLRIFTQSDQIQRLETIRNNAYANMSHLTEAMHKCLSFPDRQCVDLELTMASTDKQDLEIPIVDEVDPHSHLGKLLSAVGANNVDEAYRYAILPAGKQIIVQQDQNGLNPCHHAIKKGNSEMLALFIRENPFPEDAQRSVVHAPTDDARKYTPLFLAAEGGSPEHVACINLLCAAGALVDTKSEGGLTALQVAVIHGKPKSVYELVRRGANTKIRDSKNRSLLHLAAKSGNVELINYFLKQGFDVNDKDFQYKTPLHYAVQAGSLAAVNTLLSQNAWHKNVDIDGKSALHYATNSEAVLERLLQFYQPSIHKQQQINGDIHRAEFTHDDSCIAVAGVGRINLYNVHSGILTRVMHGNCSNRIYDLALSSDGCLLAASSGTERAYIWRLNSAQAIHQLDTGSNAGTIYVDMRKKDNLLATGNQDGTLKLWSSQTGVLLKTLPKFDYILSLKFSPDGTMLAVSSGNFSLWNPDTGELIRILSEKVGGTYSITFNHDGSLVGLSATGNPCMARIWRTEDGQLVKELSSRGKGGLAFSPKDNFLALSHYDGSKVIEFWDTKSWNLLYITEQLHHMLEKLAFNYSGSLLAGTHGIANATLWNISHDTPVHSFIRAKALKAVQMTIEKFPILFYIRNQEGMSPLELAESLHEGENADHNTYQIVQYLRSK